MPRYRVTWGPHQETVNASDTREAWMRFVDKRTSAAEYGASRQPNRYPREIQCLDSPESEPTPKPSEEVPVEESPEVSTTETVDDDSTEA